MHFIDDFIFNERFWLPKAYTWHDLRNRPEDLANNLHRPQANDLWILIPVSIFFVYLKVFLNEHVFSRIGQWCGIRVLKKTPPPYNEVLMEAYQENAHRVSRLLGAKKKKVPKANGHVPSTNGGCAKSPNGDVAMGNGHMENNNPPLTTDECSRRQSAGDAKRMTWRGQSMSMERFCELAHCSKHYAFRWFRRQLKFDTRFTRMEKFNDCMWRFCFYGQAYLWEWYCLYDQAWFADTKLIWTEYPAQTYLPTKIYIFYITQTANYMGLMMTAFLDVKRKDFQQMISHHVFCIVLLWGAYVANYTRIGVMTLFYHDLNDVQIDLAKMLHYAGQQALGVAAFVVFVLCWIYGRLYLYPQRVLGSIFYEVQPVLGSFPAYYCIFVLFLGSLFALQILWTYKILYFVFTMTTREEELSDDRSESEFTVSDDENFVANANGDAGKHKGEL